MQRASPRTGFTRGPDVPTLHVTMADSSARRFIAALDTLERTTDLEPIVACFSDEAEVGNLAAGTRFHGLDGARAFWTEYRGTFGDIRSEFRNVVEVSGRAALEWVSRGTTAQGRPFVYEGVSILELDDAGRIRRFMAYFDPTALRDEVRAGAQEA